MKENEYKALKSHDAWLYLDNAQTQRDDALARIAKHEATQADRDNAHAAALADRDAAHAAALKAKQDEADGLRTNLTAATDLIKALGGTDLGLKMQKDARKAALANSIAELQKQLADA